MSLSPIAGGGGASGRVALLLSPLILSIVVQHQPTAARPEGSYSWWSRRRGSALLLRRRRRNKQARRVTTRAKAMSARAYIGAIFAVYTMEWMDDGSDRGDMMIARTWARTTPNHVCRAAGRPVRRPSRCACPSRHREPPTKRLIILMAPLLRLAGDTAGADAARVILYCRPPRRRTAHNEPAVRARLRGKPCARRRAGADRSIDQADAWACMQVGS